MNIVKNQFSCCVLKPVAVAIVSVLISSCGGSSSSDGTNSDLLASETGNQPAETNTPDSTQSGALADGSWKLDDVVFLTDFDTEGQTVQNSNSFDNSTRTTVSDGLFDRSNGNYSGSVLRITMSTNGSGDYVVTDEAGAVSTFDSGANVAWIYVIAGTTTNNATQWDSTETSGNLTVTVNDEGRYFVSTTEPIIVSKTGESGTGVVGAPDQISLQFRNINGNPN